MSNFVSDSDYGDFATSVMFALRQWQKQMNTCIPGEVVSVDADKRRATVKPTIQHVGTDGSIIPASEVKDVPVLWPRGSEYGFYAELKAGAPVLLLFSQRGLDQWKAQHATGPAPAFGLMARKDAICVPGFGPASDLTLESEEGLSLQKDDGKEAVVLNGAITIKTENGNVVVDSEKNAVTVDGHLSVTVQSTGDITLNSGGNINLTASGNVVITAGMVTHGTVNVGNSHVHSGVQTGAGVTLGPQ